jgi:hypothetical protein
MVNTFPTTGGFCLQGKCDGRAEMDPRLCKAHTGGAWHSQRCKGQALGCERRGQLAFKARHIGQVVVDNMSRKRLPC